MSNSLSAKIREVVVQGSGRIFLGDGFYFTMVDPWFSISHKRGRSPEDVSASVLGVVKEFGTFERIDCYADYFWAYKLKRRLLKCPAKKL